MKTVGLVLLILVGGYLVGVLLGMAAIYALSSNQHDLAQEAAMTGAFFVGPLVAVLAVIVFAASRLLR